jgi:hypothetical protein
MTKRRTVLGTLWDRQHQLQGERHEGGHVRAAMTGVVTGETVTEVRGETPRPERPSPQPTPRPQPRPNPTPREPITKVRGESSNQRDIETRTRGESTT